MMTAAVSRHDRGGAEKERPDRETIRTDIEGTRPTYQRDSRH